MEKEEDEIEKNNLLLEKFIAKGDINSFIKMLKY